MSRPAPDVLLEAVNSATLKAEQVLAADAVYSVFFENRPINVKIFHKLKTYPGPKYRKVSFSNPAHAVNLAQHLNQVFGTDQFTVRKFSCNDGTQFYP